MKCPHYEPYYNEVERTKCMACPIKCYTFLKEEVSRLEKALVLACEDTNTWRNTLKICKLEPEYFLQQVDKLHEGRK